MCVRSDDCGNTVASCHKGCWAKKDYPDCFKDLTEAPTNPAPFGLLERLVRCFNELRELRRKKLFIKANGWRKGKIGWYSPYGYGFAQWDLQEAYEKECLLHACT